MTVLLLGAGGQLGRALAESAPAGVQLVARDHRGLDVTDAAALHREIAAHRPRWIINAAAITAVDPAERDPPWAVNAHAPGTLGVLGREAGATILHVSTDYVFDGRAERPYRESDEPNPINQYGRTKLEGERRLRDSGASALIVRTQWLFGGSDRAFVARMISRARQLRPTRVVDDQFGRPTYVRDLAVTLWRAVESGITGLLHVANAGQASWYDVASVVFQRVGVPELLEPVSSAAFAAPARRPRYSVLDTARADATIAPLRHWREALDQYLLDVLR